MTLDQKRDLFSQIENKTEKQIEREFAVISPEAASPDRLRQISADGYHRQFTSDQAFEDKFSYLRDLLAHSWLIVGS